MTKQSRFSYKPSYFNNLTYICGLCAVMFTKLTVEAEPLGKTTFAANHRRRGPAAGTGQSRARL